MVTEDHAGFRQPESVRRRRILEVGVFALLALFTAASAVAVKESRASLYPLAAVDAATSAELNEDRPDDRAIEVPALGDFDAPPANDATSDPLNPKSKIQNAESPPDLFASSHPSPSAPGVVRWFNGRPVRQVRSVKMIVTAYSPDDRSCPGTADGLTATLHSVATNATCLVAADPRILPYGSMLSIPGYDEGNIVPVLDCGGAIKGDHLDLLFPTHEEARQWGRKTLRVVIWEYADGAKPENPRHER